jgi:hypothetical protein
MKDLVELQKSTKLLREIYNSNVSAVRKFEIIEQVYEFSKLEASVNSIVDNLTSKSFLDELLKKINKLPIFSAK